VVDYVFVQFRQALYITINDVCVVDVFENLLEMSFVSFNPFDIRVRVQVLPKGHCSSCMCSLNHPVNIRAVRWQGYSLLVFKTNSDGAS
jgi:hypothetical protein